jgi:8-oxo-dGTP pyrophosphatase MutT (NUDIX family)
VIQVIDLKPDSNDLCSLQTQAGDRQCVVGGLIVNPAGRVFVQKRSPDRELFPGCWDIPGGHVEPGETLYQALAREIAEETGWQLTRLVALVDNFDWDTASEGETVHRREFDFSVEVQGDLDQPQIEQAKFSEYRWLGVEELGLLKEGREKDDTVIFDLVQKALMLSK